MPEEKDCFEQLLNCAKKWLKRCLSGLKELFTRILHGALYGLGFLLILWIGYRFGLLLALKDWYQRSESSTRGINNETLLGLLGILATFVGFLAWVFYYIVRRELRKELRFLAQQERIATLAAADFAVGEALWFSYYASKGVTDKLLHQAINTAQDSVIWANKLASEENEDLRCKCKNNLAIYLAANKNPSDKDKERAIELAREDYITTTNGKVEKYTTAYVCKATWALILLKFCCEKDVASKKEAMKLVNELLDDALMCKRIKNELIERWAFIQGPDSVSSILREINHGYLEEYESLLKETLKKTEKEHRENYQEIS